MVWEIPKMWEGGECWIIGGGPSMPEQFGVPKDVIASVQSQEQPPSVYSPYLSPIHGKHIIGVNAAFLIGNWIDVMIFGDSNFYFSYRLEMAKYHNIKVSCNPNMHSGKQGVYGLKYVPRNGNHPMGLSEKKNHISWNHNTGAAAINLAYHFGVKRILLLGFDMKLSDTDKQHWHGLYPSAKRTGKRNLPFHRHLQSYTPLSNDAQRLGIEILNVNENSAIGQFPKVKLNDVL